MTWGVLQSLEKRLKLGLKKQIGHRVSNQVTLVEEFQNFEQY